MEVKAAEYGLGAFATQSIKTGDFIGGNALLPITSVAGYSKAD